MTQSAKSEEPLQLVEQLKKKIYKSRPIFGKIIAKHGQKSLYQYAKHFFDVNVDSNLESRRPICLHVVKGEVEKRLGKKVAEEVERQLLKKPLVSTADHHAIIQHPFWLNANIISSLPYREFDRSVESHNSPFKHLIVFSFASVSLNNASGFPRGLLFHGGEHGEGALIRLPIFSDKWKMRTIYGTPAYTKKDLQRAKILLRQKQKEGLISEGRVKQIEEKIFSELEREEILGSEDFCEQVTKLNFRLWPKFFNEKMPDLIYIEAETMTREILLQEVLKDDSCLLYKMLFDRKTRKLFLKYFGGIPGTFSKKNEWGTYFFWTFDEKGHRVRLVLQEDKLVEDKLVSKNKNLEIPLDVKNVSKALQEKKIFPSMMTVYLTIALHYGFKCLGGFSQVHDLTSMKEALLHVLVDLGKFREIHSVCRIQTKELSGDGLVLAYTKNEKGEFTPATGLDLLLAEKKYSDQDYQKISLQVSLEEMIGPMLPEMYTVLYPSYERTGGPEESLTPEQIMKITGLDKKLETLLKLK